MESRLGSALLVLLIGAALIALLDILSGCHCKVCGRYRVRRNPAEGKGCGKCAFCGALYNGSGLHYGYENRGYVHKIR